MRTMSRTVNFYHLLQGNIELRWWRRITVSYAVLNEDRNALCTYANFAMTYVPWTGFVRDNISTKIVHFLSNLGAFVDYFSVAFTSINYPWLTLFCCQSCLHLLSLNAISFWIIGLVFWSFFLQQNLSFTMVEFRYTKWYSLDLVCEHDSLLSILGLFATVLSFTRCGLQRYRGQHDWVSLLAQFFILFYLSSS